MKQKSAELLTTQVVASLLENPEIRNFIIQANGASMFPNIVRGDRLHMERFAGGETAIGDVVLCRGISGRHYVHRVLSVDPELRTKGDNAADYDESIAEVIAVVRFVQKTWRSRLRRVKLFCTRAIHEFRARKKSPGEN